MTDRHYMECRNDILSDILYSGYSTDSYWDQFRHNPPPEFRFPEVELAVLDALTQEGITAWSGDASSCVTQIVEAYAEPYTQELREQELREQYPALKAAWDNYQTVRKLITGEHKPEYTPKNIK